MIKIRVGRRCPRQLDLVRLERLAACCNKILDARGEWNINTARSGVGKDAETAIGADCLGLEVFFITRLKLVFKRECGPPVSGLISWAHQRVRKIRIDVVWNHYPIPAVEHVDPVTGNGVEVVFGNQSDIRNSDFAALIAIDEIEDCAGCYKVVRSNRRNIGNAYLTRIVVVAQVYFCPGKHRPIINSRQRLKIENLVIQRGRCLPADRPFNKGLGLEVQVGDFSFDTYARLVSIPDAACADGNLATDRGNG